MLTAHPHQTPTTPAAGPHPAAPVAPASAAALDSAGLLHGQREILIRHGNEVYRLRHTRNDKLILTK